MSKQFWTLNKNGNEVLRNLEEEHKGFTLEKYNQGEFDGNNFIWYELFDMYSHDSNGCDYERRGCFIKEGDTVVDIGANIGVFAYRAELRGAAQVICFEPMDLTFNSLKKNIGSKTTAHKLAVGGKNEFKKFVIHTDYSHLGGGFDITKEEIRNGRDIIHEDITFSIDINSLFDGTLCDKIDFLKIDVEGGEVEIWGDGKQTRSFLFIDEAVEGVMRLLDGDYVHPVNIGSNEMIAINDLAKMVIDISGKDLSIKNVESNAIGVRGRNSDNTLIEEKLGWKPSRPLREGMEKLYNWINQKA
jgi:FkbM family methyltransferase